MDFVVDVYQLTTSFPKEEIYGLTRQLRRSAVSTASNIAEGCSRSSQRDFGHFLEMSLGSTFESETQLLIGERLKMITGPELEVILSKLHPLQRKIKLFHTRTKGFKN